MSKLKTARDGPGHWTRQMVFREIKYWKGSRFFVKFLMVRNFNCRLNCFLTRRWCRDVDSTSPYQIETFICFSIYSALFRQFNFYNNVQKPKSNLNLSSNYMYIILYTIEGISLSLLKTHTSVILVLVCLVFFLLFFRFFFLLQLFCDTYADVYVFDAVAAH